MDKYYRLLEYCKTKSPARCWFDYPPTYILSKKMEFFDIKRNMKALLDSKENFGLYINIPFCKSRCLYCMYYSELAKDNNILDIYLNALKIEIKNYQFNFKKRELVNFYVGGGTPLLLNPNQLKKFFGIVFNNFRFTPDSQFVIEGRPRDYTREKLEILKNNGFDRFTVGIQSFNENTIRSMGRDYYVKDVYQTFKDIRSIGTSYINVDIIVGLPGDNRKDYQNTLNHLFKLSPDSISCNPLFHGKRVNLKRDDSKVKQTIENDFSFVEKTLIKNGYLPIGDKRGVYLKDGNMEANNKLLFNNLNCSAYILGIGSGAVSYLPNCSYISDFAEKYIQDIKDKNNINFYGMRFDEDDKQRQYIISMLYLAQCVGLTDFYHRFNVRLLDVYKKEINDLKKIGFININLKKQEIELKNRNYNLKEFFYNMLKYFYRRDYIEEILKKMTEDKSV